MSASLKNTGRIETMTATTMGTKTFTSSTTVVAPVVEKILLPTQVIEKAVAIHEEIRNELIQEVQPVMNIEKIHTEVHQVTQPLFDKEIRPVMIEKKIMATEILPEMVTMGRGVRAAEDLSTTSVLASEMVVIEKPAIVMEIEKKQIIEEIQPVIYKETIVPTVIQETKPMYQKVVEGTVYSQETLASKSIRTEEEMRLEAEMHAYKPSEVVLAPVHNMVVLPTQVIEKAPAIHEEIRKELIEEIQPVMQIEKIKTEVHQITAPLFDKEVRPTLIERKTLATEILPEVYVPEVGVRTAADMSTTTVLATSTTLVEKPAIYNQVERTQIIEEIQPVIYRETIVPTVIQETKPMFQKIVEGTVYSHETLASKSVRTAEEMRLEAEANAYRASTEVVAPVHTEMYLPVQTVEKTAAVHETIKKEMVEEIQPVLNVEKFHTEVHQVTQPLFDREVRPVMIEKKVMATEILPEQHLAGRGFRAEAAMSTVDTIQAETVVIEKAAQVIEIEKLQIVEEIQPVIYKETVVPTVIEETKPMYQKIVEGAVYSHATLAPQSVSEWKLRHGEFHDHEEVRIVENVVAPVATTTVVMPVSGAVPMGAAPVEVLRTEVVTAPVVVAPVAGAIPMGAAPVEVITTTAVPVAVAHHDVHTGHAMSHHHTTAHVAEPHKHHSIRDMLHLHHKH